MQLLFAGLEPEVGKPAAQPRTRDFADEVAHFQEFGKNTLRQVVAVKGRDGDREVPVFINEFWTARQRQAHSLHEISYRACFKPQLPRFFIERLTKPGDTVYDPFMGRGTTLLEAALLERVPAGCDVNPLSRVLIQPRLRPPRLEEIAQRLKTIDFAADTDCPQDLLVFYHPQTLRAIASLRQTLLRKRADGTCDAIDEWIWMVALNRLTGHSPGFFSVYTLPPNQAVSVKSQRKINETRKQVPPVRDVPALILRKSRQLLSECNEATRRVLESAAAKARLITAHAAQTPEIADSSVSLVVTSPPFLNVVDYATDNWLRCWFCGIDARQVRLTVPHKLSEWSGQMTRVFHELRRVLKPGGHVAFEVGEVRCGKVLLEHAVLDCALAADFEPLLVLINDQKFTKTANCWGVDNMQKGTNTNRIVLLKKRG